MRHDGASLSHGRHGPVGFAADTCIWMVVDIHIHRLSHDFSAIHEGAWQSAFSRGSHAAPLVQAFPQGLQARRESMLIVRRLHAIHHVQHPPSTHTMPTSLYRSIGDPSDRLCYGGVVGTQANTPVAVGVAMPWTHANAQHSEACCGPAVWRRGCHKNDWRSAQD